MTVPSGVPLPVRAGTGALKKGRRVKALHGASFGVQGTLVASLLGPLPFRHTRSTARTISLDRDARSRSLCRKGKGCAPCTPARCGSPDAEASDRWPLSTNCLPAAIQGGVAVDFWTSRKRRFYLCSTAPYGQRTHSKDIAETVRGQSVVRCHSGDIRDCFGNRVYDLVTIWAVTLKTAQFFPFSQHGHLFACCIPSAISPSLASQGMCGDSDWCASIWSTFCFLPFFTMGRDHSFSNEFPSVEIEGEKFRYGREIEFGQYMLENAENAKDYWCFDRRDDLLAFLVNLPESVGELSIKARYPDWAEVSNEERLRRIHEQNDFLRQRMEEKKLAGTDKWFNVLRFDEAGYYFVNANPLHRGNCDDLHVAVEKHDVSGKSEYLVELRPQPQYGKEKKAVLLLTRKQALRMASVLAEAVSYIETQEPKE